MNIIANHSLQALNSFGFAVSAERYVRVSNDEELLTALDAAKQNQWPVFILGGGSNLVLTQNVAGLVVHPINNATVYKDEPDGTTTVTAGAGKPWHELVMETLDKGLVGLENLSLIPGSTGAAPVQNIGAYGVELASRLSSVRAFHRPTESWVTLATEDCAFAYRDSVFKQNAQDFVITHVSFNLSKNTPTVTHYSALERALGDQTLPKDNLALAKLISDTVIRIRRSKLPDPSRIGNAGSFFKNPVVTQSQANKLLITYPNLVHYPQSDGSVKLAAGWIIDELGFRGHTASGVGVHNDQALVLVNRGGGDGEALMALADEIIAKVQAVFSVKLVIEPVVI